MGLPPGALVHIGEKKTEKARITIIDYDEARFQEKDVETIEECLPLKDKPTVTWINVDGLHQVEILERIGDCFGLHPLVLEDILNAGQRPKVEDLEDYLFVVLKMLYYDRNEDEIKVEQVSLILGLNFVISFQETEGDVFDAVRERIRNAKGRIRRMRSDYLAYALIDVIVDNVSFKQVVTAIEDTDQGLPQENYLAANYPNPFNPKTVISWYVGVACKPPVNVNLIIYNTIGQKVATLVSEKQKAGFHTVEWDASGFASGVYYYMIKVGKWSDVRKMVLLR